MFRAVIIGIFLILNTIAFGKSSKLDVNNKLENDLQKRIDNIQSAIDSKVAENGHFKSYLSPDQNKQSIYDFSQLQDDVDKHMSGLDFNFDQNGYDEINLPQRSPIQTKFLLNYEPLRPSSYIPTPSSRFKHYPFNIPEHQDDGGDGGDGGDDDGGGGGGGNGGGGGGGNGGGGGGGGNGGGGGGGNGGGGGGGNGGGGGGNGGGGGGGGGGDDDGGRYLQHQSFELDYDNFEPHNGWKPIPNKYKSDIPDNQFRKKPLPKKVSGYGAKKAPIASEHYRKPIKQRPGYKQKQSLRFTDDPHTRRLVEKKRPPKVYEDDSEPFRARKNSKQPLIVNEENEPPSYFDHESEPESILDGDIEDDDPSPLQSRKFPTKKRQVCQKMSKSMTPNDIEDHDIIGRKMTCMVCKNLGSGGTFEKCSYKSDPISDEYFKDPDEVSKPQFKKFKTNRFKRRVVVKKRKQPDSGEEVEDYEYDNGNAQESEEDPEYVQTSKSVVDYENEDPENYETAENESEEYKIPPMPIKSSTCRKVMKKGNVCNVCNDNLSNRKYEQCEYEEDPKKNAYEYSTRNVYGTPRHKRQLDSDRTYDDYFKKLFPELGSTRKSSLATKFSSKDGDFGFLDNGQIGFKKTKSSLLGDKDLSINFDSGEESPVNKMLGEFRNKDRSNCKMSLKDKMTCYKCKDETGSETEECMYITDSNPKGRQQSYHGTKKFNSSPESESKSVDDKSNQNNSAQQNQPASTSLKHVYAPLFSSDYEPIGQYSHHRPRGNRNYRLHRKPVTEEPAESEEDDQSEAQSLEDYEYADDPSTKQVSRHDLPDVDPFGPEGAYSEETIPVYDPTLRTWLPRYMLAKSSEEAMVDAELASFE